MLHPLVAWAVNVCFGGRECCDMPWYAVMHSCTSTWTKGQSSVPKRVVSKEGGVCWPDAQINNDQHHVAKGAAHIPCVPPDVDRSNEDCCLEALVVQMAVLQIIAAGSNVCYGHQFPRISIWLCMILYDYVLSIGCIKHWVPMGSLKPFHPIGVNKSEPQTCDSGRAHQNVRKDDLLPQKNYKSAIISYKSAIINYKSAIINIKQRGSGRRCLSWMSWSYQTPLPLPSTPTAIAPRFRTPMVTVRYSACFSAHAVLLAFCLKLFVPSFLLKISQNLVWILLLFLAFWVLHSTTAFRHFPLNCSTFQIGLGQKLQ